jgi:hypothetical protein
MLSGREKYGGNRVPRAKSPLFLCKNIGEEINYTEVSWKVKISLDITFSYIPVPSNH